jgi:hypothetical protein
VSKASKFGFLAIFFATACATIDLYFVWKGGCVFDSKSGLGDLDAYLRLSRWSFAFGLMACAFLLAAIPAFARGKTVFGPTLGVVLFGLGFLYIGPFFVEGAWHNLCSP